MSLVGIDVGSSAVKVAAYRPDGILLGEQRVEIAGSHPHPGMWEVDPASVWAATRDALAGVTAQETVKADPPAALAVSASGREIHLATAEGDPLTPCLMAADVRGASAVGQVARLADAERWMGLCGHRPERMDPVARILYWRQRDPDLERVARWVLGWHELLTLKLGGRAVTDPGLASRWLVYDTTSGAWSTERLEWVELDPGRLPEVDQWGAVIGTVQGDVAASLGLPPGVAIGVGGFDASCAALGMGVIGAGSLALTCGSWHACVAPIRATPDPAAVLTARSSLGPHPGSDGGAVFHLSPNGGVVHAWAERLLGVAASELQTSYGEDPSPTLAVPRLQATEDGLAAVGAVLGLSLATEPADILQALAEGTAYELAVALRGLDRAGVTADVIRATGGGSSSDWWLQLVSDLTGLPVERGRQDAGTFGAAALAGLATGEYSSLAEPTGLALAGIERGFESRSDRYVRHRARLESYESTAHRLGELHDAVPEDAAPAGQRQGSTS